MIFWCYELFRWPFAIGFCLLSCVNFTFLLLKDCETNKCNFWCKHFYGKQNLYCKIFDSIFLFWGLQTYCSVFLVLNKNYNTVFIPLPDSNFILRSRFLWFIILYWNQYCKATTSCLILHKKTFTLNLGLCKLWPDLFWNLFAVTKMLRPTT